ncbi:MAG: hypothetical protein ACK4V6_03255 [Microthrixaceae bacterium]
MDLAVVAVGERAERFVDPLIDDRTAEDDEHTEVYGRQLLIAVDGVLELRRWGGLGMETDLLLNPEMPLLPALAGELVDVVVQRCGCGEAGCASLTFSMTHESDTVRWSDARDHRGPVDIGPFTFDAAEYESEVRRAHEDRPWESRSERIARLVTDRLRPEHGARPLSFEWATSWSPTTVEVSYFDYRPNPRAGQVRRFSEPDEQGWYSAAVEPAERSDQHIGSFTIGETVGDEDAVAEIVDRVHTTHPSTWPRSSTAEW